MDANTAAHAVPHEAAVGAYTRRADAQVKRK